MVESRDSFTSSKHIWAKVPIRRHLQFHTYYKHTISNFALIQFNKYIVYNKILHEYTCHKGLFLVHKTHDEHKKVLIRNHY